MNLKQTVEEVKKLQEEVSALRHENIQLKVQKNWTKYDIRIRILKLSVVYAESLKILFFLAHF